MGQFGEWVAFQKARGRVAAGVSNKLVGNGQWESCMMLDLLVDMIGVLDWLASNSIVEKMSLKTLAIRTPNLVALVEWVVG